jgi:hypothetical protein
MKMLTTLCSFITVVFITQSLCAQDTSIRKLPPTYLVQVSSKADQIQQKLDKNIDKALQQMQKLENKIRKKLSKIDSLKAQQLFADAQERYNKLENKLASKTSQLQQYIPSLDTLNTSLQFLQQNQQWLSSVKGGKEKLQTALDKVDGLKGQLQNAEEVKRFLKERRQYLNSQLEQLGFAKEIKQLSKQVYYYSEQVNEYKAMLKDHKKAERKAVELLSKTQLYKDFMQKHSELASLFRVPDLSSPAGQANLAGLQTRVQVNNFIQQQVGANAAVITQVQQNLQSAQNQINQLKSKIAQYGRSSSDDEMPEGFKPNNQKTKSFWDRLEYGTNIQSQKPNGYFPVTSDIGLSVGYKLNDKSVIGIGASYKLGWGQNIRNIKLSNQGAGLRGFIDWKIKGAFWISGGYEANYQEEFNRVQELQRLSAWQQSGLLGMSKTVSMKTRFFKQTRVYLLWDFLSYRQVPRRQPVVVRVGYSF